MPSHSESHPGGTVLRNEDGTVAFPSVVPPEIDVPTYRRPLSIDDRQKDEIVKEGQQQNVVSSINHPEAKGEDVTASHILPTTVKNGSTSINTDGPPDRPSNSSETVLLPSSNNSASHANAGSKKRHFNSNDENSSSSSSSEDEIQTAIPAQRRFGRSKKPNAKQHHSFRRFHAENDKFSTKGRVSKKDGRLNISVNETGNTGYLAKALGANFVRHIGVKTNTNSGPQRSDERNQGAVANKSVTEINSQIDALDRPRPALNIVIMVIGSRGDIQPFLRLGKILKEEHGHRVRIATHPAFRDFVQKDSGLEFFSVGGDPAELMAFMVKNPGMIPKMETFKAGEIGRRRDQMAEMFEGLWRACINTTDDEHNSKNKKLMTAGKPFVADAIIANPVSFAHIHCAERLGIPLHLMFTFPYTPTQQFPHPLANIKRSNVDPGYSNFMSYPLVDMMTWQGLGDLINHFREKTLGLEPVSTLWAPGQLYRLHVPYTYLWSPGLIPKPEDWGPEIDITGFVFLDLASTFKPPKELEEFLDAGDKPIYIGFGSIVVDDPDKFTKMIYEAVDKAGVRALVSKGWGGLGGDDDVPDNIFMLENTPHDWLFPKVKAVVHHGGAGTNAIGLKCGKPTMIVPFFGDQQFWGTMVANAGAGPTPVPYKDLTVDKLADGLRFLLSDECERGAAEMAKNIEKEGDGAQNAVKSFHRSLTLHGSHSLRCSILEDRVAVWSMKGNNIRLSAMAASILVKQRKVTWKQLRLIRHMEWNDFEGPGEPVSGAATAVVGTVTKMATGVGGIPYKITKHSKARAKHEQKKRRLSEHTRKSLDQSAGSRRVSSPTDESSSTLDNSRAGNLHLLKGGDNATPKSGDTGEPRNVDKPEKATMSKDKDKNNQDKEDESDSASVLSDDPADDVATEVAKDVGIGLGKTGEALARVPMDWTMAIAQGLHNAPRLYGDTTVRRPIRVTGYKSGFKAAKDEFVYGIYDGVTGLVTQPYTHARDEGAVGFVKGMGMGLTGFVLKDLAAIIGPFGYTFKGIHKEMVKHKQPTALIRNARIAQGEQDLDGSSVEQKKKDFEAVSHGWNVAQQVWSAMDQVRPQAGVGGRLKLMKDRKQWRDNGTFENVAMAEQALEARENGIPIEDSLAQVKEKNEKIHDIATDDGKGRANVVDEIEEAKDKDETVDLSENGAKKGDSGTFLNDQSSTKQSHSPEATALPASHECDHATSKDGKPSTESPVDELDGDQSRHRMSWRGRKSIDKSVDGVVNTKPSSEPTSNETVLVDRTLINEKKRTQTDLTDVMLAVNGISQEESAHINTNGNANGRWKA